MWRYFSFYKIFYLFLIVFSLLTIGEPLGAAESHIVATVNDAPITSFDLDQRVKLAKLSRPPFSDEEIRQQVLQNLIDEKLISQTAAKNTISVQESDVNQGIQALIDQDHLTRENFLAILKQNGIDESALKEKIRGQLLWQKFIQLNLAPRVFVSQQEIKKAKEDIEKQINKIDQDVYTLVHIVFFTPENADLLARMKRRQGVEKFIHDFKSCENLSTLLKPYDRVQHTEPIRAAYRDLEPNIQKAIRGIHKPEATPPVETQKGFETLAICTYEAQGKVHGKQDIPSSETIEQGLLAKKIETIAKQYLETLRKKATIVKE